MTIQLRPDVSQDTPVLPIQNSAPDCLLVCSDPEVLASLKVLFTDMDVPVEICSDTEAAFAQLKARRFRALIVDCDLPQGPGLLKRIRENADFQGTVRFALVGEDTSMREMSQLGATLVAHKPLHPQHARRSLHAMQSLSGLRRRRTPRTALQPFAYVTPQGEAPTRHNLLKGMVVDISETGIGVETDLDVRLGTEVDIRILLPFAGRNLQARGRVVRSIPTEKIGIRFLFFHEPDDQRLLCDWLRYMNDFTASRERAEKAVLGPVFSFSDFEAPQTAMEGKKLPVQKAGGHKRAHHAPQRGGLMRLLGGAAR